MKKPAFVAGFSFAANGCLWLRFQPVDFAIFS